MSVLLPIYTPHRYVVLLVKNAMGRAGRMFGPLELAALVLAGGSALLTVNAYNEQGSYGGGSMFPPAGGGFGSTPPRPGGGMPGPSGGGFGSTPPRPGGGAPPGGGFGATPPPPRL